MRALLLAGVVASACWGTAARADIIISLAGSPQGTGDGYYGYTYNVQLQAGQLDPVSGGTPVQFGTLYDFGPLVTTAGVVNNPASPGSVFISKTGLLADSQQQFTFSFNGTDPAAASATSTTVVSDDPNLTNVRFTYVGSNGLYVSGQPTTLGSGASAVAAGPSNLGTFTVYSPIQAITAKAYDGQTFKGTNNTQQANQGSATGPLTATMVTAVPEPATLALLGLSVAGVVAARRRTAHSDRR